MPGQLVILRLRAALAQDDFRFYANPGLTADVRREVSPSAYEGYAPAGCTAMTLFMSGDTYDWWAARKGDGTYAQEKEKLAEAVIAAVSRKYPQVNGKVEVWDVATSLTYERYLHSYKGSWMSNMVPGGKTGSYPSKPEGIARVYFAGQRITPPGGLPTAAESARAAVQHLCKDTGTVFQGRALSLSPVWCERRESRFEDDKRAPTFSIQFATPHEGGVASRTKEGMQHGRIERELES